MRFERKTTLRLRYFTHTFLKENHFANAVGDVAWMCCTTNQRKIRKKNILKEGKVRTRNAFYQPEKIRSGQK